MKSLIKYFIYLLILSFLINCEQPTELKRNNSYDREATLFGLKISSPKENEIISEQFEIQVIPTYPSTQNNLKSLKLFVNDSLLIETDKIPLSYSLNVKDLPYGYNIIHFTAISKDNRKILDSAKIAHLSSKLELVPLKLESEELVLEWEYSPDDFFSNYEIYRSDYETMANPKLLETITESTVKRFKTKPYGNYYQIIVNNSLAKRVESNIKGMNGRFVKTDSTKDGIGYAEYVTVGKDSRIYLVFKKNYEESKICVYEYNNSSLSLLKNSFVVSHDVLGIVVSLDGTIFLASGDDGLFAYSFDGSAYIKTAQIKNIGTVNNIAFGSDGTIFITSQNGGLRAYKYDGASLVNKASIHTDSYAFDLAIDSFGNIFIANWSDGIRAYTYNGSSFTNTAQLNYGGVGHSITVDKQGTIYVAEWEDGLWAFTYNGSSFTNTAYTNFGEWGNGYSLEVDSEGIIYLANGSNGLRAFTYDGSSFTNTATTKNGSQVYSVIFDSNKNIFVANGENGIFACKYIVLE